MFWGDLCGFLIPVVLLVACLARGCVRGRDPPPEPGQGALDCVCSETVTAPEGQVSPGLEGAT